MICTTYFLTFFSELIPPTGYIILLYYYYLNILLYCILILSVYTHYNSLDASYVTLKESDKSNSTRKSDSETKHI